MGCRFNSDGAGVIHYSIALSRELTIGLPGVLKIAVIDPNPHDRLSAWCKQAAVILLVYDVTNLNSFEKLNNYSQECSIFRQENIPIVLVGNKIDLHEKRVISYEQGQKWAEDNSCIYFTEISALNGFNCGEMMEYLSKVTISRHLDSNEGNHRGIDISLHLAPKVLKPHVFMHIDENENGDGIEGCFDDGDCGF
jgi:GTPase SAR1 family protein